MNNPVQTCLLTIRIQARALIIRSRSSTIVQRSGMSGSDVGSEQDTPDDMIHLYISRFCFSSILLRMPRDLEGEEF
jgi:hypothetical protein